MAAGANAGHSAVDVCWNAISSQQDGKDIGLRDIDKLPLSSDIPGKGGEEIAADAATLAKCAQCQRQRERRTVGKPVPMLTPPAAQAVMSAPR